MKKMIIAMALTMVSFQSFADTSCAEEVLKVAKSALDQKARAYQFDESAIIESTLVYYGEAEVNGTQSYDVEGYIYKGAYKVSVNVDSSCGLESLKIEEIL